MPVDARVDFVYVPTYIAATMMMTAMCRYENIRSDENFKSILHKVLNAAIGRNFLGAGYDNEEGLMDTLEIFAAGDTFKFIKQFPELNRKFTRQLVQAVTFLETSICTGRVVNSWSGKPYIERENRVMDMIKKKY